MKASSNDTQKTLRNIFIAIAGVVAALTIVYLRKESIEPREVFLWSLMGVVIFVVRQFINPRHTGRSESPPQNLPPSLPS
jgi:ABC-type Co2+ transport system permease subunit